MAIIIRSVKDYIYIKDISYNFIYVVSDYKRKKDGTDMTPQQNTT